MIFYTTLMAVSVLFSITEDLQFNKIWAETAFAEKAALVQPGRVMVLHEDGLGGTGFSTAAVGKPIRLGEKTYLHGIGVNAHSIIRVMVPEDGAMTRIIEWALTPIP